MLHCLFSVTVLKEEHATHCGEPDCSGIIDQLPGVIPRYRMGKANTSRSTLNLYLRQAADGRAQSSPFPQATMLNTGRDSSCFLHGSHQNTCFRFNLIIFSAYLSHYTKIALNLKNKTSVEKRVYNNIKGFFVILLLFVCFPFGHVFFFFFSVVVFHFFWSDKQMLYNFSIVA